MFNISLPVAVQSYMHLYITESWYLLNCSPIIYALADIYSFYIWLWRLYHFHLLFKVNLYSNVADHGYMYDLKTLLIKQSQSHFINMDIKINSIASVTVVNICQLVYHVCKRFFFVAKLSQLRYKKGNPLAPRVQLVWPKLLHVFIACSLID